MQLASKPQPQEGLSMLDICSRSSNGSSPAFSDAGSGDILQKSPKTPSSVAFIQRKFVGMLSPLLMGAYKPKRSSYDAAQKGQHAEHMEGERELEASSMLQSRAPAHLSSSGLMDFVNKINIPGVFCSPNSRSTKASAVDVVSPLNLNMLPDQLQSPSLVSPSLDRLLSAAHTCNLPASPHFPEPGTPNYPSIMLSASMTLPIRMQRRNWCLHDYTVIEKLYTGYASTVYKAICKTSGNTIVLKVYTLAAVCDLYKYQIYREVNIHSALQHEHIVHLYASFQEGDKVVLVQEYADGSDLFTIMQKFGGKLSEKLAVQLVLEPFLKVLQFLHSKGIMHRDIKPENILFDKDMTLKLCDFGLAIDLRKERPVTRAGTLDYMAPEVLRCPYKSRPGDNKDNQSLHYGPRVDSWALGVLAYEVLVGFTPFFDHNRKNTEELIQKAAPSFPLGISDDAREFLEKSLNKNVMERPTIHDMLHHPWVESYRARRSAAQVTGAVASPAPPMTPEKSTQALMAACSLTPTRSSAASASHQQQQQRPEMLLPFPRSQPVQRPMSIASAICQPIHAQHPPLQKHKPCVMLGQSTADC